MSGNKNWFQNPQVPSFAQILKRNLPIENSSKKVNPPPGYAASEDYNELNIASQVTDITESLISKVVLINHTAVIRPKRIPKDFIVRYKRGEINPVSALHQFAQMRRVQLDLKETVTAGGGRSHCFAFYAVVDGVQYKTGLGQNKKKSRSNAAKLALDELLQLNDPEPKKV